MVAQMVVMRAASSALQRVEEMGSPKAAKKAALRAASTVETRGAAMVSKKAAEKES